jgi:translation initiation factor 2 alpha subunit (eIF-2alpha)
MTRALLLSMKAGDVMARCLRENVGVSAIEQLVSGGVRLVCMSSNGAARMRKVLEAKLIEGEVVRERFRPRVAPQ